MLITDGSTARFTIQCYTIASRTITIKHNFMCYKQARLLHVQHMQYNSKFDTSASQHKIQVHACMCIAYMTCNVCAVLQKHGHGTF